MSGDFINSTYQTCMAYILTSLMEEIKLSSV